MTTLAIYGAFVRVAFMEALAFRTRFVMGVGSYFTFVSVYYFIWEAAYATRPEGASIDGFDLGQIVTYAAVAWMIRSFYFGRVDQKIAREVRSGDIARHLLRPIDYQLMRLSEAFGESAFRLVALTAPSAALVYLAFPVAAPAGLAAAAAFGLGLLFSFAIFFELSYLVGLTAAFTKQAAGLRRAKTAAVELLSGLLVPLSFFPEWAQEVLRWLPFRMVADVPLNLYLGRYAGTEALQQLGLQAGWALLLYGAGHLLWCASALARRRGSSHHSRRIALPPKAVSSSCVVASRFFWATSASSSRNGWSTDSTFSWT